MNNFELGTNENITVNIHISLCLPGELVEIRSILREITTIHTETCITGTIISVLLITL